MNPSKTAVLIDSAADLSEDLVAQYSLYTIRMKVIYHDRMYEDGLLDPAYVYKHFREEIPKTSTPNLSEVMDVLEQIKKDGYKNVIAVMISSAFSGTGGVVSAALSEDPDLHSFVLDTKDISIGSGIYAYYAATLLEGGAGFEQTKEALVKAVAQGAANLNFYMDSLEYLARGGRISPAVAMVGRVLHLKPIIATNSEGVYYPVAKVRGSEKALCRLVDLVLPEGMDISRYKICIMKGDADDLAARAKNKILERYPAADILMEKQITATMAIHTGPGLLGLCAFKYR